MRALELLVALLAADRAVLVLAQRAVDQSQLAQLLLLVHVQVLVVWLQDVFDELGGLLHLVFSVSDDVDMQLLVLVDHLGGAALATFLGAAFASHADLAASLLLQLLLSVPSRSNYQSNWVVQRIRLFRKEYSPHRLALQEVYWTTHCGVKSHHFLDDL